MPPTGALPRASPVKNFSQEEQQKAARSQQSAQLQQIESSGSVPVVETANEGAFIPMRSRRARKKQRQQLQQSLEGPYPPSTIEAAALKAGDKMDETTVLLQPLPAAESGCTGETVASDAFSPADEAAQNHKELLFKSSFSSATMSGWVEPASPSDCSESGAGASSCRLQAETRGRAAATEGSSGKTGRAADSNTKGGPRVQEKKRLYELRRIYVPAHRLTPLRKQWMMLIEPLITHLQLQVRMNVRRRCVELRRNPSSSTASHQMTMAGESSSLLQKGSDYVRAFLLGFAVRDALALLRLDDLYIESFEVRDVKRLGGEHLSRCLARLSGRGGKTKFAIENATRTRLVIADSRIHVLGSFENIRLARHACCSLILGAPPGKVYNHLRTVTRRLAERF